MTARQKGLSDLFRRFLLWQQMKFPAEAYESITEYHEEKAEAQG